MGIASSGNSNDELVDNLVEADYVKTARIESVLRAIDRARYYLPEHRENAYRDLAWRHGNLHLSAPCIYAEALEALQLEPAMSFLNIGSGTGYLSSLAGLLIGPYGLNHGIELHSDVMEYAIERQAEFIRTCASFDEFEYCMAEFCAGNCLQLASGHRLYDRVYCGAACPPEHENYMKNLIRVGGVLVMPLNDQLLQITRTSESCWSVRSVLPVSFASLIVPDKWSSTDLVELPDGSTRLHSLQVICRIAIRRLLTSNIRAEHVGIGCRRRRCPSQSRGFMRRRRRFNTVPTNIGMMVLDRFPDSDSDAEVAADGVEEEDEDDGPTPRTISRRFRAAYRLSRAMRAQPPAPAPAADEGIEEDIQEGGGEATAADDDDIGDDNAGSSSDHEDVEEEEADVSSCEHATPILSVPTRRRRRCTSSVSTSCTSGIGTCSSVDETDVDLQESLLSGTRNGKNESYETSPTSPRAKNGKSANNNNSDESPEQSNGTNGSGWLREDSPVRKDMTSVTNADYYKDDNNDEEEDVEMEKIDEDTNMTDASKNTVTISACLQEKVNALPVPYTLRQYLLFYRDGDLQ